MQFTFTNVVLPHCATGVLMSSLRLYVPLCAFHVLGRPRGTSLVHVCLHFQRCSSMAVPAAGGARGRLLRDAHLYRSRVALCVVIMPDQPVTFDVRDNHSVEGYFASLCDWMLQVC